MIKWWHFTSRRSKVSSTVTSQCSATSLYGALFNIVTQERKEDCDHTSHLVILNWQHYSSYVCVCVWKDVVVSCNLTNLQRRGSECSSSCLPHKTDWTCFIVLQRKNSIYAKTHKPTSEQQMLMWCSPGGKITTSLWGVLVVADWSVECSILPIWVFQPY